MNLIRQGSRVSVNAPAKVNLFLELLQRRPDGYHELETFMVPVSIYDTVSLENRNDDLLRLTCTWVAGMAEDAKADLPPPEQNLVYQTLRLLRSTANIGCGADVYVTKRIPSQAGLGGGSSDAAAALVAANEAWNLDWSRQELASFAAQVGSDVPFFLYDAWARCTGRGEVIEPLPSPGQLSLVIVKPPLGLSTSEVFAQAAVPQHPASSDPLRRALATANPLSIAGSLFNRLQPAAARMTEWIRTISQKMNDLAVCGHQMSGSGTSYFAVCRNYRHARHIASKLRSLRLGQVFVASTLGSGLTR